MRVWLYAVVHAHTWYPGANLVSALAYVADYRCSVVFHFGVWNFGRLQ